MTFAVNLLIEEMFVISCRQSLPLCRLHQSRYETELLSHAVNACAVISIYSFFVFTFTELVAHWLPTGSIQAAHWLPTGCLQAAHWLPNGCPMYYYNYRMLDVAGN